MSANPHNKHHKKAASVRDIWIGGVGWGIDWVGIQIGKKKKKNGRQGPNILSKAPTEAY